MPCDCQVSWSTKNVRRRTISLADLRTSFVAESRSGAAGPLDHEESAPEEDSTNLTKPDLNRILGKESDRRKENMGMKDPGSLPFSASIEL